MLTITIFQLLIVIFVYNHLQNVAQSIYFHRSLVHGSVTYHPAVSNIFKYWLWLCFGYRNNDFIVAFHRRHHMYSDTELDVSSPKVVGTFNLLVKRPVLMFVDYFKRLFVKGTEVHAINLDQFIKHTTDNSFAAKHPELGVWVFLFLNIVVFGIDGLIIWSAALFMAQVSVYVVGDGLIHLYGYTNFDTHDNSKNLSPIGVVASGEELHNNHHRYPGSAKFSIKWYEFDIGWMYIRILEMLGLAFDIKQIKITEV